MYTVCVCVLHWILLLPADFVRTNFGFYIHLSLDYPNTWCPRMPEIFGYQNDSSMSHAHQSFCMQNKQAMSRALTNVLVLDMHCNVVAIFSGQNKIASYTVRLS